MIILAVVNDKKLPFPLMPQAKLTLTVAVRVNTQTERHICRPLVYFINTDTTSLSFSTCLGSPKLM